MPRLASIDDLKGLVMSQVENRRNEELVFITESGRTFRFHHWQDCCESVSIEDIVGDLSDLVGSPIIEAEEVSSENEPPLSDNPESFTWTFYKFATRKGYVTVRWYGESNGYYSEGVNFEEV
jgi:hypothetical protein